MEAGVYMQDYEHNILEQYGIDIRSTRKIRGAVLCDTGKDLYLLKEVSVPLERIQSLAQFYLFLEKQGWCKVDKIMPNNEGEYITKEENGNQYILKKWFKGRECDVKKTGELLEAAGVLAKLHLLMRREIPGGVVDGTRIDDEYIRHNRELKKVRCFIRKVSPKSEFELEFLKNYDEMFSWAENAQKMLESSNYEKLRKSNKDNYCLVHGEYNYHNILMNDTEYNGELIAVTNFDKFKQDIQVEDFYYFLRKVMEKSGWKERLGDNIINAYSAVKPLTQDEVDYIKFRLVYPEKFWKIANAYYRSNKAWISSKNIEKLNVAIRQTKEKERFLKNVFSLSM